jgi:D-hexose-6-phosphate mutarotase
MEDRVYCSLNIGMSGIVREEQSVKTLSTYFDIGDIIQVQVEGLTSRYVVLKFLGPQIPVYINPPVT